MYGLDIQDSKNRSVVPGGQKSTGRGFFTSWVNETDCGCQSPVSPRAKYTNNVFCRFESPASTGLQDLRNEAMSFSTLFGSFESLRRNCCRVRSDRAEFIIKAIADALMFWKKQAAQTSGRTCQYSGYISGL